MLPSLSVAGRLVLPSRVCVRSFQEQLTYSKRLTKNNAQATKEKITSNDIPGAAKLITL